MNRPGFLLAALALLALCIYLFVSAPPPLPTGNAADAAGQRIDIFRVLQTVAAENDVMRALYTREIVGKGPAVGLRFDEQWRDAQVEAGPLPALFLREAAASLQKTDVPLGLFLGSDAPISPSNKFSGAQAEMFEQIKINGEAQFFRAEDTGHYTAMFPDFANADSCVSCHNDHPHSPRADWVLDEVMGATTWAYPRKQVAYEEYLAIVAAVRQGFRDAYGAYLNKAVTFNQPPEIGGRWPADGYYLPSMETFMAEFERRASPVTMSRLLDGAGPP